MKKMVKNILIYICIFYFIFSIFDISYQYITINQKIASMKMGAPTSEIHEELITLSNNLSIYQLVSSNYFNGKMSIVNHFLFLFAFSILIGGFTGLFLSLEAKSKKKYFFSFFLGYVSYWLILLLFRFVFTGNLEFTSTFLDLKLFTISLLYTPFYFIILLILWLDKKQKIKKEEH